MFSTFCAVDGTPTRGQGLGEKVGERGIGSCPAEGGGIDEWRLLVRLEYVESIAVVRPGLLFETRLGSQ